MSRGICVHCHEPVDTHEDAISHAAIEKPTNLDPTFAQAFSVTARWSHRNCHMRSIIGSVGHQMRMCTCYVKQGEAIDDPPGMTKRQAADAAVALFKRRNAADCN